MNVTIHVPKGYLGQCMCGKDAKHTVWHEFITPVPARPEFDLPEVKGIWHCVCDDCLKPDDPHKEEPKSENDGYLRRRQAS